jgi:integrase
MPEQAVTTHVLRAKKLILYRRERSDVWQCRYKVSDIWQRATTKEREIAKAIEAAHRIEIEAEFRVRSNLPIVTKQFKHVAQLAIQRMQQEQANGNGKVSYKDYILVINKYLIPILGKRSITSIDSAALEHLDAERMKIMGKVPSKSTMLTHNAALNRVFDEAIEHRFMTELNRPALSSERSNNAQSIRRPDFRIEDVRKMFVGLKEWIDAATSPRSKETRQLLNDYVILLLDTGARPGKEILDLKWKQVVFQTHPVTRPVGAWRKEGPIPGIDPEGEMETNLQRTCLLSVSGKTGYRETIGRLDSVLTLTRVAKRNYKVKTPIAEPFREVIQKHGDDYVLRMKGTKEDVRGVFHHMFEEFLEQHGLLIDPKTEQKRVFYSLRHTYATSAIIYDNVNVHILAVQMGTSVGMIEKHYSHVRVLQAIEQLRGKETRKKLKGKAPAIKQAQ